ncbi:MAG TPA: PadR family transcriptional regulator [Candidatus Polarisedimenticolia bacterium]|nr:PadR family transcriptional regulator [Candidatus Polarisedimenticolia bacterium]
MRDDDLETLQPLPPATFHVLVALADADRHGYAIMREVAERTGGRTKLNPGTLYTTIQRLLERGLIVELHERRDPGEDDERRRYYRLTALGRRAARLELERLSGMVTLGRRAGLAREKG